jgi:hypothetical protein
MHTLSHPTARPLSHVWPTAMSIRPDPAGRPPLLQLVSQGGSSADARVITEVAAWPAQQLWAHPDEAAFCRRIGEVASLVTATVAALPPRLAAGPLGCATAHNVLEFTQQGQPDRAWRLAARLIQAAAAEGDEVAGRQETLDLSVSAYMLACHHGGCVIAAVEGAAVIDRLIAAAEPMPLRYPGLSWQGAALTGHLRRRRAALLDRAVAGAGTAPGSKASIDALMYRAPVLPRYHR